MIFVPKNSVKNHKLPQRSLELDYYVSEGIKYIPRPVSLEMGQRLKTIVLLPLALKKFKKKFKKDKSNVFMVIFSNERGNVYGGGEN